MRHLTDEHNNLWLFPQGGQSAKVTSLVQFRVPWPEPHHEPFAVIDFESYYSKKYSLSEMSAWEYVNNPAFDPYCVSVMVCYGGTAYVWIGPPSLLPWSRIAKVAQWVSHNAAFDELVFNRCLALGLITGTGLHPLRWDCTSDMSRFLQRMGGLAEACRDLLGLKVDKEILKSLKGGGAVSQQELAQYNFGDCWYCGLLWCRVALPRWPEKERALSRQTRYLGWRGVWCDDVQLRANCAKLSHILTELALSIPWVGGGRSITSLEEFKKQCAREGIPPPNSLDQTDSSALLWQKHYGATRPWLKIIFRYTKARQTLTFFELMLARRRRDGTVPFELLYCKAPHTQRWQSGGGLRLQNLDRTPCEGIRVRHSMRPPPGEVFIIRDCSQIEPRVLNWLAGDWEFLKFCETQSPYEAHARAHMGYTLDKPMKKGNPAQYQLAKAEVLALGYQAGPPKFVEMARDMCNLYLHEFEATAMIELETGGTKTQVWFSERQIEEAQKGHGDRNLMTALEQRTVALFPSGQEVVRSFRAAAKKVRDYWYKLQSEMESCVGGDYLIDMPDGTILHYFDVEDRESGLVATVIKNSPDPKQRKHFYGGKLTENRVQRMSRAILGEILLRLEAILPPQIARINWHSHDEGIIRCKRQHAEEILALTEHAFNAPIPWAPGLPLASEGEIKEYYDK